MNAVLDATHIKNKINLVITRLIDVMPETILGHVTAVSGMRLEVKGLIAPMGTICLVQQNNGNYIQAEVIGFDDNVVYIMPMQEVVGIAHGAKVYPSSTLNRLPVGMNMLGRVLDASGKPIDQQGEIQFDEYYPITTESRNPLSRERIKQPLDVGVRAINGLLTVGKGQRIGIFASSGVGKSILLGMMTRNTKAQIVVVGLVGERGREVRDFIEDNIGLQGLKKTVAIVSPADTSPLMRANCALLATTVAEYFRNQGLDVLLIIDSITRYAHAAREIALSAGEMPTCKGYSPSVFAKLSQLIERSGVGEYGLGSITAFYTVLVERDEMNDPIAEHIRSILDGHIVLSHELADAGVYPAIDIEKSISRMMSHITNESHQAAATYFKRLYTTYLRNKDVITMGMYQPGTDQTIDLAIKNKELIFSYLIQHINQAAPFDQSIQQLLQFSQGKTN